ncbi:MAG: polysaccharide pyruvyl transferase family protein [Methanobrevibacter sp.]|nr:polysaccharide pyruvyl transferase family protein [Methanobrevibacter sp.]
MTFANNSDFIIKNLEEKRKIYEYLTEHKLITNAFEWYAKQIAITVNFYLNHPEDKDSIDAVLNWVWKNVSYDEYLNYKKRVINDNGVKLYYFNDWPNFGDRLNEDIISSVFNLDFEFAYFTNADLCCVGSIFDKLVTNSIIEDYNKELQKECETNKPFHIWGTGLMFDYGNTEQKGLRPYIIHALRGEKTRKRLSEILGEDISCVLADPGILSSMIIEPSEKKYHMGIVPHRWDKSERILQKMLEFYPNSKIIDVHDEPKQVLKEISQCEYIISTSLHGLVVADSYAIPNCWCEISGKVEGNGFKFHDYFSSWGTDRECLDLKEGEFPDIEKDFKCNFKSLNQLHEKQKELIDCFPFKMQ